MAQAPLGREPIALQSAQNGQKKGAFCEQTRPARSNPDHEVLLFMCGINQKKYSAFLLWSWSHPPCNQSLEILPVPFADLRPEDSKWLDG